MKPEPSRFPGAVLDVAYHLPERVVRNADFQCSHPEWDVEKTEKKTGVLSRHIAAPGETAYDLALHAARALLARHPGLAERLDAVIFCTQSPDYVMPSNAFLLQRDLGLATQLVAFDFNLACSGYVYGLMMASGLLKLGIARHVLLVTADTYSRYLAEDDRATRMLFGDGAAASWIAEPAEFVGTPLISAFEDFRCASDGLGWDKFIVPGGGQRHPLPQGAPLGSLQERRDKIEMNGLHVLNLVGDRVVSQIRSLLADHGLSADQIDQFLFHQASNLALDSLGKRLGIPPERRFSNLSRVGNTVSSSLPILVKDCMDAQPPAAGSRLFLCGFGVGYSWASLLARR